MTLFKRSINSILEGNMKRILVITIMVLMLFSSTSLLGCEMLPQNDEVTWTFDENTGILTISGNGEMESIINFVISASSDSRDNAKVSVHCPWDSYREDILHAVVEEGVTSVGAAAFLGLSPFDKC